VHARRGLACPRVDVRRAHNCGRKLGQFVAMKRFARHERETPSIPRMGTRVLARWLLISPHLQNVRGLFMKSKETLQMSLKEHLLYRGLRPLHGRLAFVHKGEIVELTVDESLYRGPFVAVLERGRAVREFRAHAGDYDWDGIAAAVIAVAEGRATEGRSGARAGGLEVNRKLANDLRSMMGTQTPHLSIEPSTQTPGRVRVKLQEIELDPLAVLQLFAALARALPEPATAH
jgi:hypothetical protein